MKCEFSMLTEERYVTFECLHCFTLVIAPDEWTFNEVNAHWVMFKREHKKCGVKKTPD